MVRRKTASWFTCAAAAALLCASPAQARPIPFKVQAQPAQSGITEFARQANVQIVAPAEALNGQRTSAVAGDLPLDEALARLLAGSGLMVAFNDGGTIGLAQRPALPPAQVAKAQPPPPPPVQAKSAPQPAAIGVMLEGIIVVSGQLSGPTPLDSPVVRTLRPSDIAATAANSGGDFFRSLPQAGNTTFNEQMLGGASPNAARGDVSNVTLRGLGQGSTLLLFNGRRMAQHPTSQTDGFGSPVLGYNANTIPLGGLERVEVMSDGPSTRYGADAVAGVINNVVATDFGRLRLRAQYDYGEGSHLAEWRAEGMAGTRFAGGRGQAEFFVGYARRPDLKVGDQAFTRSTNRLPLVSDTAFAGATSFDSRGANSPFGAFRFSDSTVAGSPVASASGVFHIQPSTLAGCTLRLGAGLCAAPGNLYGLEQRALRFDANRSFPNNSVQPALVGRYNLFGTASYDVRPDLRLYGEFSFYSAVTDAWVPLNPPLSSAPITVAANAYWNPFGPLGSASRTSGLGIPASGAPLSIVSYLPADAGPNEDRVVNAQYRVVAGAKGQWRGWSFDSAFLYGAATVYDTSTAISSTLFQAAINRTTPDAYNPFNGGSLTTPSVGDPTPNPAATIESFRVKQTRADMTQLASWDLKFSRSDLVRVPAGPVKVAGGLEVRYETYRDDRDARQDGSTPFIDSVTGARYASDLLGISPSPDVSGSRLVASAFAEINLPVIDQGMNIPGVRNLSLQGGGRFENYSDVGAVAKPKLAGSWEVLEGVRFRAAWSEGFRAPNLEILHSPSLQRSNLGVDYLRCEMDLRTGRIASYSTCSEGFPVVRAYAGNPDLKSEESENRSLGMVWQPKLAEGWGSLTLSVDRWRIAQTRVIGVLEYQNAINLDYLLRLGGSSNPNVIRAPVTADDVVVAAGSGLAAVGQLQEVRDIYRNLAPRTVAGVDLGLTYRLGGTRLGDFALDVNYARLTRFYQRPSPEQRALIEARAAGRLSKNIPLVGVGDLIGQSGNPREKWTATLTWKQRAVQAGAFLQYTAAVYEPDVIDPAGNAYAVSSQLTVNVYAQRAFGGERRTTLRVGVRNLFNTPPPLSSDGYLASLYSPAPRYLYLAIERPF